jgi:hypothetical protein
MGIAMCSPQRRDPRPDVQICLAFSSDRSDESSCANLAQKRTEKTNDYSRNQRNSRQRRGTGRACRAGKGAREEDTTPKKGAPKGKKGAKGAKTKVASKKQPEASKKAAKPKRKATATRANTKGAKILELIGRAKGATLTEIMKTTDWQAHSVRGFLSIASNKQGIKIESTRTEAGERLYKIVK